MKLRNIIFLSLAVALFASCKANKASEPYFETRGVVIAWKDLQKVADQFISAFRNDNGNWAAGFHNLDWDGENSDFCGVDFEGVVV